MGVWAACAKLENRITNDGGIMKNGDQPAKPILKASKQQGDVVSHEYEGGLTKREELATKGTWTESELQRMASKIADEANSPKDKKFQDYVSQEDPEIRMKARVRLAELLLKQLEEQTND